jgi:hypothetical protein
MEEKKINESESLDLISMMVKNARTNIRAKTMAIFFLYGVHSGRCFRFDMMLKNGNLSICIFVMVAHPFYMPSYYKTPVLKDKVRVKSYLDKTIDHITI